jgi:hypothetical protein
MRKRFFQAKLNGLAIDEYGTDSEARDLLVGLARQALMLLEKSRDVQYAEEEIARFECGQINAILIGTVRSYTLGPWHFRISEIVRNV